MGTMMALRAHARGGPEQLVYEQAPAPSAGPGEVLIAVHAAAITFAELTWDLEWTTRDGADRTPVIPSHEMSGTVAGLGDGVAGLAVGDEVIGLVDFDRDGAAAEYVVKTRFVKMHVNVGRVCDARDPVIFKPGGEDVAARRIDLSLIHI